MIKYYVISLEKAIDAIFILIKVHLGEGVYGPHTYRQISNDNEPIAMKFNMEIVRTC